MCVGDFFPVWVLYRCGKCTSGGVCVIKMKIHVHVLICNTYHAHVVVVVTTRKRSLGQGKAFTSVILFTGGGGVSASGSREERVSASGTGGGICLWVQSRGVCLWVQGGVTPPGHSLWTHTCPLSTHPRTHTPLDTHLLPSGHAHTSWTPPPLTLAIEAGGTHPTGMHSCCLFFFHFFNSNLLSCRSLKIS